MTGLVSGLSARDLETSLILLSLKNWSAACCLTVSEGDPSKVSMMKSETLGSS